MKITFNSDEVAQILKDVGVARLQRAQEVLKAIYEANLNEDIKSVIEHLDEVEA